MSDELHVRPLGDLIEHTFHAEHDPCPCGPTTQPVIRDDGSCGWVVVHHPLDGRDCPAPVVAPSDTDQGGE